VLCNRKVASLRILHLAQLCTTISHGHEKADVGIFRGFLDWSIETERFVEQSSLLEGICDLAEEVAVIKDSSAF
jgi:hypothetical protein